MPRLPHRSVAVTLAAAMVAATCPPTLASDWNRFRGPNGSGVAVDTTIPDRLAPDDAAWRVELPPGFSSPVLTDEHVFVTGHQDRSLQTLCLDRWTGELLWSKESPEKLAAPSRGPNSPVSGTPATDGENVYVFFESFGLLSYDAEGNERWRHPLGPFRNPYGMGNSPIVVGDLVVMLCDQDVGSFLIALEAATGEVRWKTERPGFTHGFSSPIVHEPPEGPRELIVSGAYQVAAYDLETGEKRWWVTGMAWQAKSLPVIGADTVYLYSWMASPSEIGLPRFTQEWEEFLAEYDANEDGVVTKDEVPDETTRKYWFLLDLDADGPLDAGDWEYVLSRSRAQNGLYAIRLGGAGDVTDTHVKWRYRRALPNIPSPLLHDGVLYVLKEGGILTALDPATGEVFKQERIPEAVDPYYASPVAASGRILTASQSGRVAVIEAGAEWEVLSVSELGEEIWATPALADDQVFVRTQTALYCFEGEG